MCFTQGKHPCYERNNGGDLSLHFTWGRGT